MKVFRKIALAALLAIAVNGFSGCDLPLQIIGSTQYNNPNWAPPYYTGARYYYMPDIETYYDLADQNFIYLNNGQWIYSSMLPSIYSGYDLYNSFIITLNINIYQPWMHHQYYVSHYPRYYYNNVYMGNDRGNIRGFNENENKQIYWQPGEIDRIKELRRNEQPFKQPQVQNPPQKTNYYGKNIGQPVKVKPQMRNKEKEKPQPGKRPGN